MGEDVRERVKERYAGAALTVLEGTGSASCCGIGGRAGPRLRGARGGLDGGRLLGRGAGGLPEAAGAASLGCGNPTALATLSPGEVVLDLGSGGGIDVLLSAKRVSPGGKAYGLDMTDEMLALAEKNKAEAGAENVEFLKGHIEEHPAARRPRGRGDLQLRHQPLHRQAQGDLRGVPRPQAGGRFAVSDMVFLGDKGRLPAEAGEEHGGVVRLRLRGALEKDEYERLLREAGFEDVSVEVTHTYERGVRRGLRVLRRLGLLRRHRDDRCDDRGGGGTAGQRLHPGPQAGSGRTLVSTGELGVVEENGVRKGRPEEGVERLVALGRALSDPIRVRMLSMMADGRGCCDFSGSGVPVEEGEEGICVCEFEDAFGDGPVEGLLPHEEAQGRGAGARGAAREVELLLPRPGGRARPPRRGRERTCGWRSRGPMNVLMVGDIVGPGAVDYLVGRLPGLRRDLEADLVWRTRRTAP